MTIKTKILNSTFIPGCKGLPCSYHNKAINGNGRKIIRENGELDNPQVHITYFARLCVCVRVHKKIDFYFFGTHLINTIHVS